MNRRSLIFICPLIVTLFATGALVAQKGGKGKGGNGGGANQEILAEFQFPFDSGLITPNTDPGELITAILIGDGNQLSTSGNFSIYENQNEDYPGVGAAFFGSGNPHLNLNDPQRWLIVRFEDDTPGSGSCGVADQTFYANGDSLWFANTANLPDWRDPDFQLIDGAFLGMTTGIDEAYSMLILRFILPDESGTDFLWKAHFGDWEGATNPSLQKTRVKITVEEWDNGNPIHWRVVGLDDDQKSVARVTSVGPKVKGKSQSYDWGYCRTLIDFDIRRVP